MRSKNYAGKSRAGGRGNHGINHTRSTGSSSRLYTKPPYKISPKQVSNAWLNKVKLSTYLSSAATARAHVPRTAPPVPCALGAWRQVVRSPGRLHHTRRLCGCLVVYTTLAVGC
jgi:hypothetical protein